MLARRAVQVGALVAIVGAGLAFAFRQRLGISSWFGGSGADRDATAPSELGTDAADRGGTLGATGAEDRSGGLAFPQIRPSEARASVVEQTDRVALHALSGRVIDEDGKPVVGADVRVLEDAVRKRSFGGINDLFGYLGVEPTPLARTTTGADGRFRVEEVPTGPLAVVASASGDRVATELVQLIETGPATGEPTLTLEGGAFVGGVVVDGTGAPVGSATLTLVDFQRLDDRSFFARRAFTTSDAAGRFRVRVDASVQKMTAFVQASGYPTTIVRIAEDGRGALKIVLVSGATIEVRVEDEIHHGIEGAQVSLTVDRSDPSEAHTFGFLYARTDSMGVARFVSGPGKISGLSVGHPDFDAASSSPVRDVVVADGEVTRLIVPLARGVLVRGRVLDPSGTPIADATVEATRGRRGFVSASSRSSADGSYQVRASWGVDDGVRMLGRWDQPAVHVRARGWSQPQGPTVLDLTKAKDGELTHDVTLVPAATVRGRAIDDEGRGVASAQVWICCADGGRAITAADGRYEIDDVPMQESSREICVAAWGLHRVINASTPFPVAAGATIDVPDIRLTRGATIRGKVFEPSGRPAVGASIAVSMDDDGRLPLIYDYFGTQFSNPIRTDPDGAFVVPTIARGKGVVEAQMKGFALTHVPIEIGDDDPAPIELRLPILIKDK